MRGMTAKVIKKVEIISCHFTVLSTFSIVIFEKLVAKREVKKDTQIPAAVINRGK
jgi:hypothetical protein